MNKHWTNIGENTYALLRGDIEVGKFKFFNTLNSKAVAESKENEFHFKRISFWKNTVEISDKAGLIIAKIFSEKWYASSYILEYNNQHYKVVLRNNPLAEYVIIDNETEILAYGLTTHQGKAIVRINSNADEINILFDFILWYLFRPIAIENTGEDVNFLIVATA